MSENEENNYQLIKVYVRQRPFTKDESELRMSSIIQKMYTNELILGLGSTEKKYKFDRIFRDDSTQAEIYDIVVSPLIDFIITGYNCTVFAYGQTGTGKTYTMIGSDISSNKGFYNDVSAGMIPRAASHLFSQLRTLAGKFEYTVTISFIEIYNEEVRDLLMRDDRPLKIYDDPVNRGSAYIKGVTEMTVFNTDDVYIWLDIGTRARQTAQTDLNRHSSRSHTIFTLVVHTCEITADGKEVRKTGKLHLTDLAGSENIRRSGAVDLRAREAGTINKSLLTLGKVIKSLAKKQPHIPYRDSKLTRILQDSLGGNTKTCMIATFSPCSIAWDETISALDYAHVARSVANCPQVNVNVKQVDVVKDLQSKLVKLRQELSAARSGDGFYITKEAYTEMKEEQENKNQRLAILNKEIQMIEEQIQHNKTQYKKINDSFEKTKSYLDNIQQELEMKELKKKQNEYVLKCLDGRTQELGATAEVLIGVCETSIKHEDIYHKKYEQQRGSTVYNARIADSLCSTALKSVGEVENCSVRFVENQTTLIPVIKEKTNVYDQYMENFIKSNKDLQTQMAECGFSFDKVFNCSEKKVQDTVSNIFTCNQLSELERQTAIKKSVNLLKDNVVATNVKSKDMLESYLQLIKKECDEEEEYLSVTENIEDQLIKDVSDRLIKIEEQINQKNEHIAVLEKILFMEEHDHKNVLTEIDSFQNSIKTVDEQLAILDKFDNTNNLTTAKIQMEKIKEHLCETTDTQLSMLQSTVNILESSEKSSEDQIFSDMEKLHQYFTDLSTMGKENLKFYNKKMKNLLCDFMKPMPLSTKTLHDNALKYYEEIQEATKDLSDSIASYSSDLKKIVKLSLDCIEGFKENVKITAHNGDTPVKCDYDYPRNIKTKVDPEILFEEFKKSAFDGECDTF